MWVMIHYYGVQIYSYWLRCLHAAWREYKEIPVKVRNDINKAVDHLIQQVEAP